MVRYVTRASRLWSRYARNSTCLVLCGAMDMGADRRRLGPTMVRVVMDQLLSATNSVRRVLPPSDGSLGFRLRRGGARGPQFVQFTA